MSFIKYMYSSYMKEDVIRRRTDAAQEKQHSVAPRRWEIVTAWVVPVLVLPSAVWRLALVTGAFGGDAPPVGTSLAERLYVPTLSFASVGCSLLTLGLVHRWGEIVPTWIPLLGGRRVPPRAAAVPAMVGGTLLTLLTAYAILNAHFHWVVRVKPLIGDDPGGPGIGGFAEKIGVWAYAPLAL